MILKYLIRPAVGACGYNAMRADEMPEPGMITSQVIQRILDDPLVVADLTEHNANVFYELALRHAIRKPLVQLIAKGERIPFDVAGMRTIAVDHRDIESVEAAKTQIVDQIKAMERPEATVDTPVTMSVDIHTLQSSHKPVERSLADILSAISELRSAVFAIDQRLTEGSSNTVLDRLGSDENLLRNVLVQRSMRSMDGKRLRELFFNASPSARGIFLEDEAVLARMFPESVTTTPAENPARTDADSKKGALGTE
ncbi:MAG TPA: hypothetical protein VI485_31045 [Vicinamibacterales bacterium]|nr:hypothetical protein [Vicinamibacterales bacterium]